LKDEIEKKTKNKKKLAWVNLSNPLSKSWDCDNLIQTKQKNNLSQHKLTCQTCD
jgi:hypothetical protein